VHLAVVWNGSRPVAYVDGVPDSMSYNITQESFTCCDFGDSEPCYTPDPALITLDEVRAWNFARTPAEIQSTMFRELVGSEAGLIAYWPMNEGTGQATLDHSGGNTIQLGVSADPDSHDPAWVATHWLEPVTVMPETWGRIKAAFTRPSSP
jgi:hypothetical protein